MVTGMAVKVVVTGMLGVMAMVTVAIGTAALPIGTATAIGMGATGMGEIGTVAIGMVVAIGIGGMVGGGPMVLVLVGEWFLAAGFGSVTDRA
jgi:hypothetical protein